MVKSDTATVIVGICLLLGAGVLGATTYSTTGEQPDYQYEYYVKAEQVNENEMPDSSVNYDNLTEAEQEVLFRAFKKSDHFLGGSGAVVYTDERINTSDGWKVVRVKGVPILMAIEGPDRTLSPESRSDARAVAVGWLLTFILGGVGLFLTGAGLNELRKEGG